MSTPLQQALLVDITPTDETTSCITSEIMTPHLSRHTADYRIMSSVQTIQPWSLPFPPLNSLAEGNSIRASCAKQDIYLCSLRKGGLSKDGVCVCGCVYDACVSVVH